MGELSSLQNIGKAIENKLNKVGIFTKAQLFELGSKEAFIRIRFNEPTVCINMLCAIEGAIEGVSWNNLPNAKKAELKEFYSALQK